jgi:hypothetical protein
MRVVERVRLGKLHQKTWSNTIAIERIVQVVKTSRLQPCIYIISYTVGRSAGRTLASNP